MKQQWTVLVFGALIFFLPFLGFPSSWEMVFLFLAGVVVSGIALSNILKERNTNQSHTASRAETNPHDNT